MLYMCFAYNFVGYKHSLLPSFMNWCSFLGLAAVLPTSFLFWEFCKKIGIYTVVEKQTKAFQTSSPIQPSKIKSLIWEFIINLWAYVVVENPKFSEFLGRGITTATAFQQKQRSTQRQNIVQLLMTSPYPCSELVFSSWFVYGFKVSDLDTPTC